MNAKNANDKILDFYKQKSMYTNLGLYEDFAKNLPDDINELCLLQRRQIIHPFDLKNNDDKFDSYYGDLSAIPKYYRTFEDDLFPTALSMIAELLRRDKNYLYKRNVKDKLHVTCRGQALLLTSILKAKKVASRCRCGFGYYVSSLKGSAGDHWIVEYYDQLKGKWILVDPDFHDFDKETLIDSNNILEKDFLTAPKAYLKIRNKTLNEKEIYYAQTPYEYGLKAAIRYLIYDFNCLMNNEIFFEHLPKSILSKNFDLNENELKELDKIATLMLNPDRNFNKLKKIWETNITLLPTSGGFN